MVTAFGISLGGLLSARSSAIACPPSSSSGGANVPTALIIAERDTLVPKRRSAPLRAAIENLVFERAIDAGHNDLYDHPDFAKAAREALVRIETTSGETP